jgi:hypothetical protein
MPQCVLQCELPKTAVSGRPTCIFILVFESVFMIVTWLLTVSYFNIIVSEGNNNQSQKQRILDLPRMECNGCSRRRSGRKDFLYC